MVLCRVNSSVSPEPSPYFLLVGRIQVKDSDNCFFLLVGVRSGRRQSVRRPSPLIALQPVNEPPNPLSA